IDRVCSGQPSHEERLAGRELQRQLARLIASLKPPLRDALLLAAGGEHSYEEIAAMLGIPAGTLKWRVSEARRILRTKLAATGYTDE
ncbi:MAG TPA: RNA polymerase sigma factor, partial [Vicinamibacterales bacterium]|nr:RNA polymerase sigma factor [Vicinamibacterales bacterium]